MNKVTAFTAALVTAVLVVPCVAAVKAEGRLFDPVARLTVELSPEEDARFAELAGQVKWPGRMDVLFLGDSLTDFDRGRNHADILEHSLNRARPGCVRVYNYAVAGDFITRTVDRLNGRKGTWKLERMNDFRDRPYDIAFVLLGSNDTATRSDSDYTKPLVSLEDERRGYEELIAKLRAQGVGRIVLMSSHSPDLDTCRARCEANPKPVKALFGDPRHLENFNALIRRIASEQGLEFLDIYTEMKAIPDKVKYLREKDGVHLSDCGYRFVAERIIRHLAATPMKTAVLPANAEVVLDSGAGESAKYAAEEFRTWSARLEAARGDASAVPEGAVRLGKLKLLETVEYGDEGFCIAVGDDAVTVAGGKRGVLYGVYEILERFGGIDWLSARCTVVPKGRVIGLPAGWRSVGKPVFESRRASWWEVLAGRNPDFSARCRQNGYDMGLVAKHGGDPHLFGAGLEGHTFYCLFPQTRFPTNEYDSCYAQNMLRLENPRDRQLCMSNPFVFEIVTSNLLERIAKDPGGRFYSVSKKDGNKNYCRCPKCMAVDEEEGSTAGTYVRFLNRVGEAVEKVYPKVRLTTLVYTSTRKPAKTKFRHNVVPYFCAYEADFSMPMAESPNAQTQALVADARGWAANSNDMILWDYITCFYNYLYTYPNVYSLGPNLRFYRSLGCRQIARLQGDSRGAHGDMAELKNYLVSKLMWDPTVPVDELVERFCRGYYGAAAPFVLDYLQRLHALDRDRVNHPLRLYESAEFLNIPNAFLDEALQLWNKAEAAVRDDPERAYNVKMGKLAVMYTRFSRVGLATSSKKDRPGWDAKALARWIKEAVDSSREPVRYAENTSRNNTLRQAIEDAADIRYPVDGLVWKWTPMMIGTYDFELSEKPDFPAEATKTWRRLKEAQVTLNGLEPATVYYWRTRDAQGRREVGHFTTAGDGGENVPTPSAPGDSPEKAPDGFMVVE